MLNYTYIITAFTISLIFSLIGTPFVVKMCNTNGIYDLPNTRKVHKHAIPRLGGTLFMPSLSVGMVITLLIMYQGINKDFEIGISNVMMVVGSILIYLIGIIDDLKGLKASHKFIIQTIAALLFPLCNLMISNLHGLFGIYNIPIWVGYPLTVFIILLIVNAMNLIDGIDGLASGLACLILGSFAYLYFQLEAYLFSLISISLAGATLAFFFFNMYGKVGSLKTFMGDSGSLFLGYVIAYLAIKYQMSQEPIGFPYREESLLISFTLVFIPCIDAIRVALWRKFNGKAMFEPDKTHLHHRIMQMGLDMRQTLAVIITLFISICLINYGLYEGGLETTYIIGIDIAIYSIFVWTVVSLNIQLNEYISQQNKMRSKVKVSIITVTYNSAKTLADTIQSVLDQTHRDIEYIIVDGASTDGTLDIIKHFEPIFNGRMKWISEKDHGIYDAMNKGIAMATGDVIGTLNSDDYYTTHDVIERIIAAFNEPALDAVYGDIHFIRDGEPNKCVRYYSSKHFHPKWLRFGMMPAHPSFYCRKIIYQKVGLYKTNYKIGSDYDMMVRMFWVHHINARYLPMDFVTMRTGGASTRDIQSRCQIIKDDVRACRENGIYTNSLMICMKFFYKIFELRM